MNHHTNAYPGSYTAAQQVTLRQVFAVLAFLAGLGTPFTVNVVGEMPLGEVILFVALYGLGYMLLERRWPVPLFKSPTFQALMICQFIAFGGYVMSDFYRGSSAHDAMRGWARMAFLLVDLFATTYLFGLSSVNFILMGGVGASIGRCVGVLFTPPLFNDYWKFGFGGPLTLLLVVVVPQFSITLAAPALVAMGCLHLVLGFRSLGGECFLIAVALVAMRFPTRVRLLVLVVLGVGAAASGSLFYLSHQSTEEGTRSSRSDIERRAMMTAAWDGFAKSPLIGQGSWFSKSDVLTNYVALRTQWAAEAGVGGFDANENTDTVAVHSQILVSLAEGGIFGACFFVVYGLNVLWAMGYCILSRQLDDASAIYLLVLTASLTALFFSPFSGAHRENIAVAAAVTMVCWRQWGDSRQARAALHARRDPSPHGRREEEEGLALGG